MSLQSNYADIRNWLGLALMACGQQSEAYEQFKMAIQINPNYVAAMINAGVACEMMGLKEDAVELLQQSRRTRPRQHRGKRAIGRQERYLTQYDGSELLNHTLWHRTTLYATIGVIFHHTLLCDFKAAGAFLFDRSYCRVCLRHDAGYEINGR